MKKKATFVLSMVLVIFSGVARPLGEEGSGVMDEILKIEDSAMEEWRKGNPMKWIEISSDDVIYIDPGLTAPIFGKDAYLKYLEPLKGKIYYDQSEYVLPKVARYGQTAVLTYNYHSLNIDEIKGFQRTSFWNTSEVYRLIGNQWKIIHTHWSYIQHHLPESLEMKIPVVKKESMAPSGTAAEIMALETASLQRWKKGDPTGFLEISAPEVTCFDTGTSARINGYQALENEYRKQSGRIHYDVMEIINPQVMVFDESVVLFYQFLSTLLNPDGTIRSRIPWNCTKVFAKIAGTWKIVHSHRSYINGRREGGGI